MLNLLFILSYFLFHFILAIRFIYCLWHSFGNWIFDFNSLRIFLNTEHAQNLKESRITFCFLMLPDWFSYTILIFFESYLQKYFHYLKYTPALLINLSISISASSHLPGEWNLVFSVKMVCFCTKSVPLQ